MEVTDRPNLFIGVHFKIKERVFIIANGRFPISYTMIFRPGVYILGTQKANAEFIDNKLKCYYVSDASQPCTLTITRIDSAVISGTFSMKINNPPCGTMNITEGRFDLKAN